MAAKDADADGRFPAAKPNRVGSISLGVAVGGLAVTAALRALGYDHWTLHVLLGGFEAATVGALADLYAVTALFSEVPIPLLRRHSNIIINNRAAIEDMIARKVQTEWLSRETLRAHIQSNSPSAMLTSLADNPPRLRQVEGWIGGGLLAVVDRLDSPECVAVLDRLLKQQLAGLDLGGPIGRLIESLVAQDERRPWDPLLAALGDSLKSPRFRHAIAASLESGVRAYLPNLLAQLDRPQLRAFVREQVIQGLTAADLATLLADLLDKTVQRKAHDPLVAALLSALELQLQQNQAIRGEIDRWIESALDAYRHEHSFKGPIVIKMGELFVKRQEVIDVVMRSVVRELKAAQADSGHRLRRMVDELMADLAAGLKQEDSPAAQAVARLQVKLAEHTDWDAVLDRIFAVLRETLLAESTGPGRGPKLIDYEALAEAVQSMAASFVDGIRTQPDHPLRERLDGAVLDFARQLQAGRSPAADVVDQFKERLLADPGLADLLRAWLRRAKDDLAAQLQTADSPMSALISTFIRRALADLRANPQGQAALDARLIPLLMDFVESNQPRIGDMVRNALAEKDPQEAVSSIRREVGGHLQYIRLNGAIVGGTLGVIFAIVRIAGPTVVPGLLGGR